MKRVTNSKARYLELANWRNWVISLGLFVLALAVRVPGLSGFVTFDEPQWVDRSRWFVSGLIFDDLECPAVEFGREFATQGLGCTLQIGYPGVTTMWAGSLGLLGHYWQSASPTGPDLKTFLQRLSIFALDPAVIAPTRLPLAVVGALFVPYFYELLRRLFSKEVAAVAALLVALQPFHIALSRVLHHDALVTTFMVLSLLALTGYWLRGWPWYWLIASGVLGGLALLSKQTSWFMPPYVVVLAGLTWGYRSRRWLALRRLLAEGIVWGLVAGLTFVALFPAMWVIPGEVVRAIFSGTNTLAEEGHTHYFLGEVSTNPGPFFYPVGWLVRATPLEALGLLATVAAAAWPFSVRRSLIERVRERPVELALALFVGLLWLFVSVSDKKLVRYFLPAFPIIDVFVALGLMWLLKWLSRLGTGQAGPWIRRRGLLLLGGLILVGQGWLTLDNYPYYLTYHNPLLGGTAGAARLMTLVGWGEGLNEAAAYLNRQPGAESLRVLAERTCTVFRPFFVGQVFCLNHSLGGILRADYFVYYYNVIQRDLGWPEQRDYFQRHSTPEHRVTLHGLDYVLIYRNPIQHPVDRAANSLPKTLTTFGYNLSPDGQLTLFWQNLGLGQRRLLVGLAPSRGVYPIDASAVDAKRRWLRCTPAPDFAAEVNTPQAIIESVCPLGTARLDPGLYDLQLGLSPGASVEPIETSRLAVLQVEAGGLFEPVELVEAEHLVEKAK